MIKKDGLWASPTSCSVLGAARMFRRGGNGCKGAGGEENHDNASGSQSLGRSGRGDSLELKALSLPVTEFPLTVIESR